MTKPVKLTDEAYECGKSAMLPGETWSTWVIRMAKSSGANRTNNNTTSNQASAQEPVIVSAPYVEHNKAIILPSGTVLVNEEKTIIDINGQPIIFPDIPSARKMVKYLKEYTSNPFQRCINPWQGNIITIERWYTEHDEKNGIPAIELAETIKFLRTIQTLSS